MIKPNYEFKKRQKEMKRQKKAEEKRLRRLNKGREEEVLVPLTGPVSHDPLDNPPEPVKPVEPKQ